MAAARRRHDGQGVTGILMTKDLSGWTPPPFPPRVALEGRWCRLEPLSANTHTTAIWRHMAGADDLATWMSWPPPLSEAEYHALLAAMEPRHDIVPYAVVDRGDGLAKGHLWIMEIRPAHGVFEVGSIMLSPAIQRSRIATEAIFLVGDHGFGLGYRRYEWKCNDLNAPSKRAALRFGFTFEGLFRQHMVVKGKSRDTAWFSITDGEWPDRKARFERWLAPENFDALGRQKVVLSEA
jgi:RimJ/RimL family protein N-acetyltransferase